MQDRVCPCDPKQKYMDCCGQYIEDKQIAQMPEQLMRSRYSAYVMGCVDYIEKTMAGPAIKNFDPMDVKNWIEQVQWKGLNVIKAYPCIPGEKQGYVEYCACYEQQGKKQLLHELSEFRLQDSHWFYWSGKFIQCKRNETCPCGSGLKFKRCCYQE